MYRGGPLFNRFVHCVAAFCLLGVATSGPAAAAGGGTDYLEPADRTAMSGMSTDPWRVGPLPRPEFSGVVASRSYPGVYWAIRDASKGKDRLTAATDGKDCPYNALTTDATCTRLRNRARTQLWAYKLASGQLSAWNTSLSGVDPANPYFRRFTLPRTSSTAPDYDLTPSYAALADDPIQLMNNDWEDIAVNPRTGKLEIGAIGTYSSTSPLCNNRRVIEAGEPTPGGASNQWQPTVIRDLPSYAINTAGTNCGAEALLWLDDLATTTGRLYMIDKRVRSWNPPRLLEIGLNPASGRAVGAARATDPAWVSSHLLNLPPDASTTIDGTAVRLDSSDEVTGADVSQDGRRAVITLGNCGFLVYDSPTTAGMYAVLRDNDDVAGTADPPSELPGYRLYGNATSADDPVQRNKCQSTPFGLAPWSQDCGAAPGFQPGPLGIEGVTFIGNTYYLSMVEDTTFLDSTGNVTLGSRMLRVIP
jgi:hypothetical protein